MTLYETVVDTSVANSSHSLIVDLIGEGKTVLDVGCSTGYLADALNARGCTVSGIEYDEESAERARPKLAELVVGDLNLTPLDEAFQGKTFDRIVFGDVLEHLASPGLVLRSALRLLAPGGEIVLSVPNVAHGSLRLALLQGRWRYRDTGLLDRTHVGFYTLDSLLTLIGEAGFVAREVHSTVLDPLDTEVEIADSELPAGVVEWVRHEPRALDYQYVIAAAPGQTATTPSVQPAISLDDVRVKDEHTAQALRDRDEQHRMLTIRDHVIGLESSVASLQEEVESLRHRNADLKRVLAEVAEDRRQARQSVTWRVGSAVTSPVRAVRKVVRKGDR